MEVPQVNREIKVIEKKDFMPMTYKRSKKHLVTERKIDLKKFKEL